MASASNRNFFGGIDQLSDPTKIDESHYYLLVNARTRRNTARPVALPRDYTSGLPAGTIQGLYAFNTYAIVFIGGLAFVRDFASSGNWNQVAGFAMSATAPRIYLEAVPSSYTNFARTATAVDSKSVELKGVQNSSPSCAVVMDGVSQPWVILPNGNAYELGTYGSWTTANTEYVPVAILPKYINGVLYCVGKDAYGKYNQLYRSVTGMPLNFVIAVTDTGDKIDPSEELGGAPALAYRVDFDDTTCLQPINAVDGSFVVTTARNSYMVKPDYTNLIYAEPTFTNQFLFSVGALNQDSVVDANGDAAIIHFSGLRSFNGISQYRFEGKNSPFSAPINDLFVGITQTTTAAVTFDNYCAFSVTTKYGKAVAWYDTITATWTAIDMFPGVGLVKQFAQLVSATDRRLLFYTEDNRLFEYFGGDGYATAALYSREYLPASDAAEMSVQCVTGTFVNINGSINAACIPFIDRVAQPPQTLSYESTSPYDNDGFVAVPFNTQTDNTSVLNFPFNFGGTPTPYGQRVGIMLMWSGEAELLSYTVNMPEQAQPLANAAQSTTFATVTPDVLIFIADDGVDSAERDALNEVIQLEEFDYIVGVGGHSYDHGTVTDVNDRLVIYWSILINAGKTIFAAGAPEMDTARGAAFFSILHQAPGHYFRRALRHTELFITTTGYDSTGVQQEPTNTTAATLATSAQMTGLVADLAESTGKFKIVVAYDPVYSSESSANATRLAAMQAIDFGNANLVCSGRSRMYERFNRNGKTAITVPSAGATPGSWVTAAANSVNRFTGLGYVVVSVYPMHAELVCKDATGSVVDSTIIMR